MCLKLSKGPIIFLFCNTISRYPILSKRYPVLCKVHTGYYATSEIEHGSPACMVDNLHAKANGLPLREGGQTMV